MERSDRRTWLSGERPRRAALLKFEEHGPVARSPTKQLPFLAVLVGVEQVIAALGNGRKQVGVLATDAEVVVLVERRVIEVSDRIPSRRVRFQTIDRLAYRRMRTRIGHIHWRRL